MFTLVVAALASLFSLSAAAQSGTDQSLLVNYVQAKYANQNPGYPVLIFDRDEISWRIARAGAFGDEERRLKIVGEYVKEKSGYEPSLNDVSNFDIYLTTMAESAIALPVLRDGASGPVQFCAVFPAGLNSNRRLESERILQLLVPNLYQKDFSQIRRPMSLKQLTWISLFHELSHCLDTRFFPESLTGQDPSADQIHRNESFAETLALLLLVKEGMTGLGADRSAYRSVYARMIGEFLAKKGENGFSANASFGGPIYYLSPVIEAAQARIEKDPAALRDADIGTLRKIAEEIVVEHSLPFQTLNLIKYAYTDGREAAFDRAKKFEVDFPTMFQGSTERLTRYFENTDRILANFWQGSEAPPTAAPLRDFETKEFCPALSGGQSGAFFSLLQSFRRDLQTENGIADAQRLRAVTLQKSYELASNACTVAPPHSFLRNTAKPGARIGSASRLRSACFQLQL